MERDEIIGLIMEGLEEKGIAPYKGRRPLGFAKGTPNALLFKVTCGCGVAAMLSVDIPSDSSDEKVREMIPHLAGGLDRQARQFSRMPCEVHSRISVG